MTTKCSCGICGEQPPYLFVHCSRCLSQIGKNIEDIEDIEDGEDCDDIEDSGDFRLVLVTQEDGSTHIEAYCSTCGFAVYSSAADGKFTWKNLLDIDD